jgi:hypothetical protein
VEPTFVRLTVQGGWSGVGAPGFRLLVDGYPIEVEGAGMHDFPVTPGRHDLGSSASWLRRYGYASTDGEVGAAQLVEVFYAPPLHVLAKGSAGPRKQRARGLTGLVAYLVVILLAFWFVANLLVL